MNVRGWLRFLDSELFRMEDGFLCSLSEEQMVDLVSALKKVVQKDVCPFCEKILSEYENESNFCGVCNRVLDSCDGCPIVEPLYEQCLVCSRHILDGDV